MGGVAADEYLLSLEFVLFVESREHLLHVRLEHQTADHQLVQYVVHLRSAFTCIGFRIIDLLFPLVTDTIFSLKFNPMNNLDIRNGLSRGPPKHKNYKKKE